MSITSTEEFPRSIYLFIILIAVISVLSHWNVWRNGVFSLGWNTSLLWLSIGALLVWNNALIRFRLDWHWLLPLGILALSFGLYENPWLKTITFLTMPIVVGVFFSVGHVKNKKNQRWGAWFLFELLSRTLKVITKMPYSVSLIRARSSKSVDAKNLGALRRVRRALTILIPLMFMVITLLSSADPNFEALVFEYLDSLGELFVWSQVAKLFWILLLSTVLVSVYLTQRKELDVSHLGKYRHVDDLVASIVLIAILAIYIVFLSLQLNYLLVSTLPLDFADTEQLVKSGFWQLLLLSVINVGLFYWVYKQTGTVAQWILRLYLIASALIVVSAVWRMSLYVISYGLSYEKFFATYTSIYALALFTFLAWASFSRSRKDIVKVVCISSLWMFSFANVLPIERIIFSSNFALSERERSRIELVHLSHLSTDVLSLVITRFDADELVDRATWRNWLTRVAQKNCSRSWYESNLSVEFNCRVIGY
jgi:hypothetical protein